MLTRLLSIAILWIAILSPAAAALPAAGEPEEMCGDGTTFTVQLPGLAGSLPYDLNVPADNVTLPNGCGIYAIFVSGYSVNPLLNYLSFYKLARLVAERNGYVHYAWWNNFMGAYQSRPLHGEELLPLKIPLPNGDIDTVRLTPGRLPVNIVGFVPVDFGDDASYKAVPEEDKQFQQDARLVIRAIRQRNPDALIIVAGHSMGGAAVARLGATPDVPIDLLAPIDPVGNRSSPVGLRGHETFNWNRWRVANDMLGYRQVDCVRDGVFCRDFDPRPFRFSHRCEPVGPLLPNPPILWSRSPLCLRREPYIVMNPRPRIGPNVRMLYHRWQREFPFPFDIFEDERINRGPRTGLLGGNYQEPLLRNSINEGDPDKSCGVPGSWDVYLVIAQLLLPGFPLPAAGPQPRDPRDENISCTPFDGHGEIVGLRGSLTPYGVRAPKWQCYKGVREPKPNGDDDCADTYTPECADTDTPDACGRRQNLVEMTTAPAPDPAKTIVDLSNWAHEPLNPHLDLVVDDLIAIVEHLRAGAPGEADTTAPETEASPSPAPNPNGWHMQDVQVDLLASDVGPSGVEQIEYSITGAQPAGPVVTPGPSAQATIMAEGLSTVQFAARDHAGNVESPREFVVRLDRTAPDLSAELDVEPNTAGWINRPVTVTFDAADTLSGIAEVTGPVTLTTEGRDQEVTGAAVDLAGNDAAAAAIVNLDFTPPQITLEAPGEDAVVLLNATVPARFDCADSLSGVAACIGTVADGAAIDTASVGGKSISVQAADHADNTTAMVRTYAVQYDFSGFGQPLAPEGIVNAVNAGRVVPIKYTLRDAAGVVISDLASFASLESSPAACDGGSSVETLEADSAGASTIRFDPESMQFVYNWATAKAWAGSCRTLRLTLNDGRQHMALFRLR